MHYNIIAANPGLYYVTIRAKFHWEYFGVIENNKMILNDIGRLVENCWNQIPTHFPNIFLNEYIIMPDHVHGIIQIICNNKIMRCGRDEDWRCGRDAINRVSTNMQPVENSIISKHGGITGRYNPMLNNYSLSNIIRWFKGRACYEINKLYSTPPFFWQTRFYIILFKTKKN